MPKNSINITRRLLDAEQAKRTRAVLDLEGRILSLVCLIIVILLLVIAIDATTGMMGMLVVIPFRVIYYIQLREIRVVYTRDRIWDVNLGTWRETVQASTEEVRPYKVTLDLVNIKTGKTVIHQSDTDLRSISQVLEVLRNNNGTVSEIQYVDVPLTRKYKDSLGFVIK